MKSFKMIAVLGWLGLSACAPSLVEQLGETLNVDQGPEAVSAPSLAFGPNGHLVVSWAGPADIHVRRWTGTRWEALGGGLSAFPGDTRAYWSSLLVDEQGDPVVAWQEKVPGDLLRASIIVRRWADGRWVELGGPLNIGPDTYDAYKPSLQLDSEGNLLVAWSEDASTERIAVRRWGPDGWQPLGPETVATGTAWGLELAGDTPILLSLRFVDSSSLQQVIEVRRWTGSTWELLGDPVGTRAIAPQLRADAAGNLVLAWLEQGAWPAPDRLQVARWSGTAWEVLSPDVAVSSDGNVVNVPALAFDAEGQPLVAWTHHYQSTQSVRVARWTGQDWDMKVLQEHTAFFGSSNGASQIGFHPAQGVVVAWTPDRAADLRVLRLLP